MTHIRESVRPIPSHGVANFAWQNLRRFQNADLVNELLSKDLEPEAAVKHRRNLKKQAEQIRWSLQQAREYFRAAREVSTATQPLLLYYGCAALALTEVLWRGTGDHSIDKMRANHGHHGLEQFITPNRTHNFEAAAIQIRAKPKIRSGNRYGLFEAWHQLSRHKCISGNRREILGDVETNAPRAILFPPDTRIGELPIDGISLFECIKSVPALAQPVTSVGLAPRFVRGSLEEQVRRAKDPDGQVEGTFMLTVHPGNDADIKLVRDEIENSILDKIASPVIFTDFESGFRVKAPHSEQLHIPDGVSLNRDMTYFFLPGSQLNEFGYYYVALFLAGMLSRYYPDMWMWHVEGNTELHYLLECLFESAFDRLPLWTLGVIESRLFIYES